ncbi:hypothetical protein ACH4E7_21895 [Kitasatospora sp. NPDC018058]|uniref:hypothetical protein n=1 Tax=Kitasatospora sp. NPDC018058 TaxID=3364025 RepID=UPI0037BEE5DB
MTWWLLRGQFSRPVRAISPGRRATHRQVAQWRTEPGFADGVRLELMHRIWRDRTGVDDPLLGLSEAELFRRIFGRDQEGTARDRT